MWYVLTKKLIRYGLSDSVFCLGGLFLEAVATEGHSTNDDEQQSDRALYLYFFIIFILILITFDR